MPKVRFVLAQHMRFENHPEEKRPMFAAGAGGFGGAAKPEPASDSRRLRRAFAFLKKSGDVRDKMRSHLLPQDRRKQLAIERFYYTPSHTSIGAHQVDDVSRQRRNIATAGAGVENDAQSLLHLNPIPSRDVSQHIVDVPMPTERSNDRKNQLVDGYLRPRPRSRKLSILIEPSHFPIL